MRRVLSKNNNAKATNEPRHYAYADADDSKARHILGLDITNFKPSRKNSISSTSTNKLRSVTFSTATTAAATTTDTSQSEKGNPSLVSRKPSSALLRRNKKLESQTDTIKPKLSSSSLRSFYDKSRAPLNVSQQTSESSSRDFALRKGSPSIVSASTQETEHSRQIRLANGLPKNRSRERSKFSPSVTRLSNSSSKSLVPSFEETVSETAESLSSQPSTSRISILRSAISDDLKPSTTPKSYLKMESPFPSAKLELDPARAKINVRRPKAGTKDWFDSLDTDSSEDESTPREPQLADNFALDMTGALRKGQSERIPLSNSSRGPSGLRVEIPEMPLAELHDEPLKSYCANSTTSKASRHRPGRKRKVGAFENVDLTKQSILHLDSSDDEDEDETVQKKPEASFQESFGSSVASGPEDNARAEVSRARPMSTEDSEKVLLRLQKERLQRQPASRRANTRMMTYLEDCSTETVTQQDDLLTSFPQTPTETHSKASSLREFILSEDEGSTNTKLMTVTRQEESLIAAMRLKKTAMKRAQAIAHRQGTLSTLEHNNTPGSVRPTRPGRTGSLGKTGRPYSPVMQPRIHSPIPPTQHSQRTDSVTTFQTDSLPQQSVRSSIATYLSEGSEDLQLPYSISDGLPMGSSRLVRASSAQSDRPRGNRDTFLSEVSTSVYTTSPSEWSPSVRDSHVVELDPLDRQMLREEIPSQLFMERPFIGWEAQASLQKAH